MWSLLSASCSLSSASCASLLSVPHGLHMRRHVSLNPSNPHRDFKAILGECVLAIDMARLTRGSNQVHLGGIQAHGGMGPAKQTVQKQRHNHSLDHHQAPDAPKVPRHKQLEVLLQGMRSAQACLREVQAEKIMFIAQGRSEDSFSSYRMITAGNGTPTSTNTTTRTTTLFSSGGWNENTERQSARRLCR